MNELDLTEIFLAEDNPADVMLVKRALQEHSIRCHLTVMGDGAEAVRFFQRLDGDAAARPPDLVLLDLHLPKQGGHEILRHVRASLRCAQTPVVMMSSSDSPNDRADAKTQAASYFRKPTDLDAFMELGTLVKRALAGRAA